MVRVPFGWEQALGYFQRAQKLKQFSHTDLAHYPFKSTDSGVIWKQLIVTTGDLSSAEDNRHRGRGMGTFRYWISRLSN